MSTGLLYNGFGVRGYRYVRTKYVHGVLVQRVFMTLPGGNQSVCFHPKGLQKVAGPAHPVPVELSWRPTVMSENRRQTPRKPVTKFAHLQKKMEKQKVQVKKPRKK